MIPKVLLVGALVLFAGIGVLALSKKSRTDVPVLVESVKPNLSSIASRLPSDRTEDFDLPSIDRINALFSVDAPYQFPIVETISYSSNVSWLPGKPAWIADYAVYYNTSKHFISRSLRGKPEYLTQKISTGSRFNVFKRDKKIEFHLVVDVSRCKAAFYYLDLVSHERVLLKVYRVGLGRKVPEKPSGTLTPLGTYQLGDKVAIYAPGVTGLFHEQKTEMVRVFGSRWIPFGLEIAECSEPAKGYGIHGAPWILEEKTGTLVENRECIGKYESDGCIRLWQEDMEEIYAIVVSKPTFVHVVPKFQDITLPGVEVASPAREERR